jgi:hypothetical protein
MLYASLAPRPARLILLSAAMLAVYPAGAHNIDPKADIHPTAILMGNVTWALTPGLVPKSLSRAMSLSACTST